MLFEKDFEIQKRQQKTSTIGLMGFGWIKRLSKVLFVEVPRLLPVSFAESVFQNWANVGRENLV